MDSSFVQKHNISVLGNLTAQETLVFIHGFGSEQSVWRLILPAFEEYYRIVLFDLIGSTFASANAFQASHHETLGSYAEDVIQIFHCLELNQVILIAHSASCMIGSLVAMAHPNLVKKMVFISASPCYANIGNYVGGLTKTQIANVLAEVTNNYVNWVMNYAPIVMNTPEQPALAEEFKQSLLNMRPDVAMLMLRVILNSDFREQIKKLEVPVLIIQPQEDIFVPLQVGDYLHQAIRNSQLCLISVKGHLPHLSNPQAITQAIAAYLELN